MSGETGVHDHVVLDREFHLTTVRVLLVRGDLVEADLADRDDPLLERVARHQFQDFLRQGTVVRLLGIQTDRAIVRDAELRGAKPLPADQRGEVVDESADVGARLATPEGRLDHRSNPGVGHRLDVVGRAAGQVNVRIEERHRIKIEDKK